MRKAVEVGVLADGPLDHVSDPPDGVCAELVAQFGIEPLNSLDETQIPLGDEISKGKRRPPIITGYLDDESQIALNDAFEGLGIPRFCEGNQLSEFLSGHDGIVGEVLQVGLGYLLGRVESEHWDSFV